MRKWYRFIFIGLFLLVWQCAHKVAPSGGPEDKTPPLLVASQPDSFQINVDPGITIQLIFSEKLQESSVTDQVWVIPDPPGGITVTAQKNEIRIQPGDSLLSGITYQVIVGTGVQDRHGNPLPEPVQLIFSTGATIDSARIAGKVLVETNSNWYVLAHSRREQLPESLVVQRAHYILPLGEEGQFQLQALKEGQYFLFALRDGNGDKQYQPGEPIALPPFYIALNPQHTEFNNLVLKPIREDFQPPGMTSVIAVNQRRIQINFDEEVHPCTAVVVHLADSSSGRGLSILGAAVNPGNNQQLFLFTKNQKDVVYTGWLTGICDEHNNSIDTLTLRVRGSSAPDTVTPAILNIVPGDGSENVAYSASLVLTFTQPVDTATVPENVIWQSEQGDTVSGHWNFTNLLQPYFQPDSLLERGQRYQVAIHLNQLRTLWGEAFGDSLRIFHFSTIDWAELGEIEGQVIVPDSLKPYPIIVEALAVGNQNQVIGKSRVDSGGVFLIPYLPEGQYTLRAFVDRNANGRWDGGGTRPFRFEEPLAIETRPIRVRKRWTSQGAEIRFY